MDLLDAAVQLTPSVATAAVAIYAIRDGRGRQKDQRRADVIKMGLDYALKRKFALMDRVAEQAARYEGLLQYRGRYAVAATPEGFDRVEALTGGYEAWGSYRAAAHELGDPELESACIGLGNDVSRLLVKRPDLASSEQGIEDQAYKKAATVWTRLTALRIDLEHTMPTDRSEA